MAIDCSPSRFNQLLIELDITNGEVARLSGVDPSSVQRWLAGQARIPMSVIRMLSLMVVIRKGNEMIQVRWSRPEEDPLRIAS